MLWDIACVGSIGAALYLRFWRRDQIGGALFGLLSMVCSLWSSYRERWRREHGDRE